MGQTLSSPATEKRTDSGGNNRFMYAVSEMQGWRISMEDAHAVVLDLDGVQEDSNTFFAVYDGHGGGSVAKFAGQNVHKRLVKEESYLEQQYEAALKRAFLGTDEDILADPNHLREPSGCTAVAALITNDQKIYVANAGDSRSVLSVKGEVKPLSFDHKPSNEVERRRITAAGGFVDYGRVNGNLALSRALGDFDFKKNEKMNPEDQIITADPDVTVHVITEEDEFLVIACDGIWDCLTSQQVVDFVRLHVSLGKELSDIAELICDHCLAPDTSSNAGIGCDNMTVLIVAILNGRTKEEWYAWIHDRMDKDHGYETPRTLPQLYAMSRLLSFRARRDAQKARERARLEQEQARGNDEEGVSNTNPGDDSGLPTRGEFYARLMGPTGGISFHPGSQIMSDSGQLMFTNTDSSDDEDDDNSDYGGLRTNESIRHIGGIGFTRNMAVGLSALKSCLEDLDFGVDGSGSVNGFEADEEGDTHMEVLDDTDEEDDAKTPHPSVHQDGDDATKLTVNISEPSTPTAKSLPNGDAKLTEQVGGEEPSPATKVEGLLDASENPIKA